MQHNTSRATRLAILAGVFALLAAMIALIAPDAQAQDSYELSVGSAVILADASGEVTLSLVPNNSNVAGLGGTITFDDTLLTATACTPIAAVSACNTDVAGEVGFQALDPSGWDEPADLISIEFTNTGLSSGEAALTILIEDSVNAVPETIVGELVPGAVTTTTHGDVNCDSEINVVDALLIAQFAVNNRTGVGSCPLADPASQILEPNIDVNCDDETSIVDALYVAQFAVGNRVGVETCPLADPAGEIYIGP